MTESDDAGVAETDTSPERPVSDSGSAADGGRAEDAACGPGSTCCPASGEQPAGGHCGYGWQRRITLDGSQVSTTLTDFPVLVRISDRHLQEHAALSGADLYFTSDDGRSLLEFEVESYSAGELVAWVRVAELAAGVDTTLFLGYSDGKADRANATDVWSDFHHVWHMAQDPGTGADAIRDSTDRAHGTPRGAMTSQALQPGVAGPSLRFDGIDDEISFFNDLWGSGPSTFSGWVKQEGSLGEYGTSMISLGDGTGDGSARFMLSHADDGKVKCGFYGNDDLTTAILPRQEWKYLTWTWDGSSSAVYIDAVRVLGPASHNQVNTSGVTGKIGNSSFRFAYFMYGQLDELHVATRAHSSAWIATEYANQRPGSSFIKALGEPQPAAEH